MEVTIQKHMGAFHDMASYSDFQTEAKDPKALNFNLSSFFSLCSFLFSPPFFPFFPFPVHTNERAI
jgi:hypothetical protein